MKTNKYDFINIGVSIFIACLMILSNFLELDSLFKIDTETMNYLFIAIWFVPYTILNEKSSELKSKSCKQESLTKQ